MSYPQPAHPLTAHPLTAHPRSSRVFSDKPRLLNPSPDERLWIRTIPDIYPDILRAPAVSYRPDRDDPRIRANKYVTFARPYKCHQGLLLIGTDHRPILINEAEPDRAKVIPMRLDREGIWDNWVFAVSIYATEGVIQIEDCIVANGEQLRSSKGFKERHTYLQRFVDHIWCSDQRFQLNWQLSAATFIPLGEIKITLCSIKEGYLCLMPDSPEFRLLKVVPVKQRVLETSGGHTGGPSTFWCSPSEGKPDVYDLKKPNGEEAGRASVQTLSLSQALQQRAATEKAWRVSAEWDNEFEAYRIVSIL